MTNQPLSADTLRQLSPECIMMQFVRRWWKAGGV
jgi:hypothetical protein